MTTAITKESLAARIADLEYGPRSLKEDYTLAAYKMLLATMGAEPVGTLSVRAMSYSGKKFGTQFGFVHSDAAMKVPEGDCPLYRHAQPAPVVQDNSDPRDAFEDVFPMPTHVERCGMGYVVTAYSAWTAYEFVKKWEGWNACRAAMLNGGKS